MKNICIIPARGGSKRVPNKNIVNFHGKPLLAHTIEAAKKSGLFGKNIYVSSDSDRILAIAKKYGVQGIRRPKNISGDKATLEQAAQHLLGTLSVKFDDLCLLMPSSPLRGAMDVKKSYQVFKSSRTGSLISVAKYNWLYPFWAMQEKNGSLDFFFGRKYLTDSKLLPRDVYCPAGGIRWMKVKRFLREKRFYGPGIAKYVIPFGRSADIDTYEDLQLTKKLYQIV